MWRFITSRLLTVIIFCSGAVHGILVVGPKFIRANQDYMLVISNFQSSLSNVDLWLRMEGYTDDGRNVLNVTKMIDVPGNTTKMVNFNMPNDLSAGKYKITIDGQSDYIFHMEADLMYITSMSGLIQINKPMFKPGDTVQFRVIVLDMELKPPALVKSVHVTISDPQNNLIREWPSAELYTGVFENDLQLASTAMPGMWKTSVQVDGEELVSQMFEVKECVLSSFDLDVIPSVVPLEKHQGLNLTISANYHFRNPVNGLAVVELYLDENELDQKKELEVYGVAQVSLRFVGHFGVNEDQRDVFVKTTFIERHTNRTVVKQSQITVYKYPYRVEMIKETLQFRPRLPFKCTLQFLYHDGKPAKGITGKVEVIDIEYESTATSDDEGLIKLELNPIGDAAEMYINFSTDDGFYFYERVGKMEILTNMYIKLELKTPIKMNRLLQFMVTCSEPMTFFVYYIVSKGNIIDAGLIRPNNQNKYPFRLNASEKMIPRAKVIVVTVVNRLVVYDIMDICSEELRNNFNLSINKQVARPGQQIELRMSGRPGIYVGLAAYSKGLTDSNKNHDLFWEKLMRVYNGFGSIVENEFDKFRGAGLFIRTIDDIKFNEAHDMAEHYELQINNPILKPDSNRTKPPESWLWQNVTIGRSGAHNMIDGVPNTITSWYLTGFSIDPEYGLGIVKQPIQFTTIQPFYITESLPNSIKRHEAVELQFILFNNLERMSAIADVTLYNVANQTEFIGQALSDLSYTKFVHVPPTVGVPVSFLVKARKLGEMVVRVKATFFAGQVTDTLEKVIQVMPESVVSSKKDSWFFSFDSYTNKTFVKVLDMIPNAEIGSLKMEFRLNPNLPTDVIDKLDKLLEVPSGSGESNMVRFVPNIMVRDYLHSIGSKDQVLINKATNLLREGYQRQMRYRQSDGSFGVWQNIGGNVFLTAFVAKSIQIAGKYISEINVTIVESAYDWLASKQHTSGRFDEVGSTIHEDMKGGLRDGISLTSYVVTALLENENARVKHAVVIAKAMSYLSSQVDSIDNAYDLSIATYALMLNGHPLKHSALNKLVEMSTFMYDGAKQYWSTDNEIETTAYALLSFVMAEKYLEGIPVMRWLVNQRYFTGSFPRTQGNFVGLNALTKLAEKISPSHNEYDIHVVFNNFTKHFHINSQDINTIYSVDIPVNTKSMEINVTGIGVGLLEVFYEYNLSLENFENRFALELERQNTSSDNELRLKVCASFIPTLLDAESSVTMIEVTFPSGYDVDQNPISDRVGEIPIQSIDIRYGGTSVVVYYHNMGEKRNCFTVTAYRRGKVAMKRPAYVVAYDAVKPNLNAIKMY